MYHGWDDTAVSVNGYPQASHCALRSLYPRLVHLPPLSPEKLARASRARHPARPILPPVAGKNRGGAKFGDPSGWRSERAPVKKVVIKSLRSDFDRNFSKNRVRNARICFEYPA